MTKNFDDMLTEIREQRERNRRALGTATEPPPVKWEAAGLPGRPVWVVQGKYEPVANLDSLVRAPDGTPILCGSVLPLARMIADRYGYTCEAVHFIVDEEMFKRRHESEVMSEHFTAGRYGLLQAAGGRISLPEREAAAAMAWQLDQYLFVVNRGENYLLPKLYDEVRPRNPGEPFGLPWRMLTEAKAYQLCMLLQQYFCMDSRVVKGDAGYYVAVDDGEALAEPSTLIRVYDYLTLLEDFDIVPNDNGQVVHPEADMPPTLDDIAQLSRNIARRAGHDERVETALSEIIARLEGLEGKGTILEVAGPGKAGGRKRAARSA